MNCWRGGPSALFIVTACGAAGGGGATAGSASVSGTVAGAAVPTNDAIALVGPVTATDPSTGAMVTVQEVVVLVSNQAPLCDAARQGKNRPNATSLAISVGSLTPLGTGTFPVAVLSAAGIEANVFYTAQNAMCAPTTNQPALSGTVTISVLSTTTVAGKFDVSLQSGDHVTGQFMAPVCNADLNAFVNTTAGACGG